MVVVSSTDIRIWEQGSTVDADSTAENRLACGRSGNVYAWTRHNTHVPRVVFEPLVPPLPSVATFLSAFLGQPKSGRWASAAGLEAEFSESRVLHPSVQPSALQRSVQRSGAQRTTGTS